jgi:hypothetical protein
MPHQGAELRRSQQKQAARHKQSGKENHASELDRLCWPWIDTQGRQGGAYTGPKEAASYVAWRSSGRAS